MSRFSSFYPRSRRQRWLLLAALLVATLVVVVLANGWSRGGAPDKTHEARSGARGEGPPGRPGRGGARGGGAPVSVVTAVAEHGSLPVFLDALGSVTPANSVLVRSRVEGQLLRLHFTEGQSVRAGQLLAEIDPRPFEVLLAQARGALARDEALLQNARVDLQRYRDLWTQDSIAKQQVDAQEALVQQYAGTVEAIRGQVDNARLQLEYARITAPISGRVGLRLVDPGNIVQANDATGLVRIAQLQPVQVVFTLPEDTLPELLPKLAAGSRLKVEAHDRALRNRLAEGELLTVDNQIDAATGTVKLKAQFANNDSALFPNQFVNIRLLLETLPNALLVPTAAIQRGADGNFVYVVADSSVRPQPVDLGPVADAKVVVMRGLAAGDVVVVDGVDRLRAGSKVSSVDISAAAKPAAVAADAAPQPPSRRRG